MPDNFPTDGPISLGDSLGSDKSISYFIGYCGGNYPNAPYSLRALVELAQNEGIEFPNGDFAAPYSMSEFYAMLCGDSSCSILMDDGSYVLMDSGDNLLLDDCVDGVFGDVTCCIDSEGSLGCVLTEGGSTVDAESCGTCCINSEDPVDCWLAEDGGTIDAESCATCCIELFDGSCILLADGVNSLDLAVCS